jgi:hypothetical protein
MLRRSCAFILLFGASVAGAQQSLFQSGNGETSIYLRQSVAAINLGNSTASLGFYHRLNEEHPAIGAEAYATANSGVTTLFSSNAPKAPEGGGDGTFSWHYLFFPKPVAGSTGPQKEDWLLLDAGYGRSSFYVYPLNTVPPSNVQKTDFDRFRTIVAYNQALHGDVIWGIATGAERRNNISDLKSYTLQTTIVPSPTGSQSSIVNTQAGYYGNYKVYIGVPVYTDILWYLPPTVIVPGFGNRLGLDFLSRSDVAAPNRASSGGLGIYLFKKDDPLSAIGGVSATYDGSKVTVTLTAGLTSK